MKPKSIFITGIGGFIGRALAERALKEKYKVGGIDLKTSHLTGLEKAELFEGSFSDTEAVAKMAEGYDCIINTAAIVAEDGDWTLFREVNVEAPARLAKAAKTKSFIHFSSVMVYGFYYPDGVNEDSPVSGDNNPYCQTKIDSEEKLRTICAEKKILLTIIRPGDVYGIGSIPWVERPLQMMRQGIFSLPDDKKGLLNHVYLDNLLDAVFTCLQKGVPDDTFVITDGRRTTAAEYFTKLAEAGGVNPPGYLPLWLLQAVAVSMNLAGKVFRFKPPLNPEAVRYIERSGLYSNEKSVKKLNFKARVSLEEGMRIIGEHYNNLK